jgi:hypothetical protein
MYIRKPWKDDDSLELLSTWKSIKIHERKNELELLVTDQKISEEDISFAKSLTFSEQNIIDNYSGIKKIIELLNDKLINFLDLKTIIRKNHWNMDSIESLKKQIPIKSLQVWCKTSVKSVLNIKV